MRHCKSSFERSEGTPPLLLNVGLNPERSESILRFARENPESDRDITSWILWFLPRYAMALREAETTGANV